MTLKVEMQTEIFENQLEKKIDFCFNSKSENRERERESVHNKIQSHFEGRVRRQDSNKTLFTWK